MRSKLYGVIDNIVGNEGEGHGALSIAAMLAPGRMMPDSRIVVGSPSSSEVNLAQFVLTSEQGRALIAMLSKACDDVDAALKETP